MLSNKQQHKKADFVAFVLMVFLEFAKVSLLPSLSDFSCCLFFLGFQDFNRAQSFTENYHEAYLISIKETSVVDFPSFVMA
ncbi:CLUMA_CG010235, isoform A [Clunio marinus]|uniref:CLUMA_CG010235, isoform A n=1 Tax=Clunio marinus TaxID=568069 RepID=A0A1J1I9D1_9DIPT|nr:CLUMA_CG010235, isoform A [Clunio marinus]